MGGALWVFLWLWRETDAEGDVRGGRPIQVGEIARDLGMAERSVKRHLATLRANDYLETWKEQLGFSAWLVLGKTKQEIGQDGSRRANSGPSGVTNLAPQTASKANSGPTESPPGPPLKGIKSITRLRTGVVLTNSPPCELKEPTTTTVVPFDRGSRSARKPGAAAVDAGVRPPLPPSPTMQAIEQGLARIPEWERPELTRTLLNALLRLAPYQVEHAFERAWASHRTRRKALDNPAGWWAAMLTSWVKQWEQIRASEARHENDE